MKGEDVTPRVTAIAVPACLAALTLAGVGCGRDDASDSAGAPAAAAGNTSAALAGAVSIDGSSTVAPLATAAAERFQSENPGVQVTVGTSGTGGGFERFCNGETDISNASRPIKEDEEAPLCAEAGIDYTELLVANDGLTVVVNADNDWVDCLTTEQLRAIWEPGSKVDSWDDVDPSFPDEELTLAGPGTDSGTFDFFTDEINGEEGASRTDYNATEDDNVIVQSVAGETGGLGYFGYSYYEQNRDSLKALAIDGGEGCIAPSVETVQDGTYAPLSRPLFMYVKSDSIARPEVAGYLRYLVEDGDAVAEASQLIGLTEEQKGTEADELQGAIAAAGTAG
jgi:phosphate transport system substrate-binding protein